MTKPNYRVIKDYPLHKIGDVWKWVGTYWSCESVFGNTSVLYTNEIDRLVKDGYLEKVDTRWKPKRGDDYYYIDDDGNFYGSSWDGYMLEISRYDFGNCFKTEEEAEEARDKVKELLLSLHKE